jgi:hypothetical protein
MKGGAILLSLFLLIGGLENLRALPADPAGGAGFMVIASYAQGAASDAAVPLSIRNNKYYLESIRLTGLAQDSYEEGDYDASVDYASEALRYARLSDEYVALQLKIREADQAIAAAKGRIDWAVSVGAPARYPAEYGVAEAEYGNARTARSEEDWDEAVAAARRVLAVLAGVEAAPARIVLPAQYTVRAWNISKDCFWNIAGRDWVYGDPTKWRLLYNANKANLPKSDNPDLMEPGMVLDIPSIRGEERQGLWDAAKEYPPLP